jgi:hypothetical protein
LGTLNATTIENTTSGNHSSQDY